MPRGTPIAVKCPKCKRGKYGHGSIEKGVRETGFVENKITKSGHKGVGGGGRSFWGYRGEVECLDCGHVWFSTHARQRIERLDVEFGKVSQEELHRRIRTTSPGMSEGQIYNAIKKRLFQIEGVKGIGPCRDGRFGIWLKQNEDEVKAKCREVFVRTGQEPAFFFGGREVS